MSKHAQLILKKSEHKRILAGHLWVYSNEVDTQKSSLKQFQPGDLVDIFNQENRFIATAYINPHNLLTARVLTTLPNTTIDHCFFLQRLQVAFAKRQSLFNQPYYRLVFGESDFLPGVVVDRFNDVIVVQISTAGMEALKEYLVAAIDELLNPNIIILKNDAKSREQEGLPCYVEFCKGNSIDEISLIENEVSFIVPATSGQKTGWFFDHRNNRALLQKIAKDKKVLDVFSYVGGWGIQAAMFGAKQCVCVDSSEPALTYLQKNAALNHIENKISTINDDAFKALSTLQSQGEKFDVIIVDPPAFIKKRKDIPAGEKAYQRINELALALLNPQGFLLSASCSMLLPEHRLRELLARASHKTARHLSILQSLHQGFDHPVHFNIPETNYLKGFLVG
ncbi:MAG: class I SAM-dependent rRNA methyltransferase [Legionellales bacterium]|nr:class I SAM-dependent rRNA methyltransferase [Legionellales bacterium]